MKIILLWKTINFVFLSGKNIIPAAATCLKVGMLFFFQAATWQRRQLVSLPSHIPAGQNFNLLFCDAAAATREEGSRYSLKSPISHPPPTQFCGGGGSPLCGVREGRGRSITSPKVPIQIIRHVRILHSEIKKRPRTDQDIRHTELPSHHEMMMITMRGDRPQIIIRRTVVVTKLAFVESNDLWGWRDSGHFGAVSILSR